MILLFSLFFNQVCRSIYEKNPGPDTDIPLSEVYVRLGDLQRFNGKVVCVCVCLYEREREREINIQIDIQIDMNIKCPDKKQKQKGM